MSAAGCSADHTGPTITSGEGLVSATGGSSGSSTSTGPTTGASTASPSGSSSGSSSTSASTTVVDGVPLTAQGTSLAVGQTATVSFQPRQNQTGVLDVTVDRLARTSFKRSFVGWEIPSAEKSAQPYFVHATVTNRGALDLGGRPVPLYIVDGTNTLVQATTFASTFKACRPGRFPASFPTGATARVCLVYLAPQAGTLAAVSFRPTQRFDPITWTGPVRHLRSGGSSASPSAGASPGSSASPSS